MSSADFPSGTAGDEFDSPDGHGSRQRFPSLISIVHILWLKKWLMLGIWLGLALPVGGLLLIFDIPRSYNAATVMRFPSVVGAQTNVMRDVAITQGESIISIFRSFQVLDATAKQLSLRFRITTPNLFFKEVFNSLKYSDQIGVGVYTLHFQNPEKVKLMYKPANAREAYPVFDGPLQGGKLTTPDLQMEFQSQFLKSARNAEVEFQCLSQDETNNALKGAFAIRPLGGSNFQVSLEDRDPYLVADILNLLREEFLRIYYGTTEVQNVGVLAQMEKDLEIAKGRLEQSQNEVSKYYAENPELMTQDRTNTGDNGITYLEARQELEAHQNRRTRIMGVVRAKPAEDKTQERYYWGMELVAALSDAGEAKANILRSRLAEIEAQGAALRAQLGQGHPRLVEIENQKTELYRDIEKVQTDAVQSLDAKIADARARMNRSAPTSARSVSVKVRLELDRLVAVNQNNQSIYDNLLQAYNRAKLVTGSEFFKVSVVDVARPALYEPPTFKTRLLFAGAAIVLIFVAVPGLFGGWHMLFQRVYTSEDVKRLLRVRFIGSISQGLVPAPSKPKTPATTSEAETEALLLFFGKAYKLADLEAYRLIREEAESFFRNPKRPDRLVLMITSTQPGEGKTLTSSNLALTFARKGKRTLLIDADFRLGRVAQVFNAQPSTGLDEMLSQEGLGLDEFLAAASLCFVPSLQDGLIIVPRKIKNPNAGEMVSSDRFKAFVRMASEQFDVVIIDTPPMMITPEPLALSEMVDGVLFVTRSGLTPIGMAREALQVLADRKVRVGAILNGVNHSPFESDRYQKYSYYYMRGEPSSKGQKA